jgi:hypothetical protein
MRYRAHQYEVGNKVWINKTLFSDNYSRAQSSDKLTAKRYGPFVIRKLVGKNAVRLELPDHLLAPALLKLGSRTCKDE